MQTIMRAFIFPALFYSHNIQSERKYSLLYIIYMQVGQDEVAGNHSEKI